MGLTFIFFMAAVGVLATSPIWFPIYVVLRAKHAIGEWWRSEDGLTQAQVEELQARAMWGQPSAVESIVIDDDPDE